MRREPASENRRDRPRLRVVALCILVLGPLAAQSAAAGASFYSFIDAQGTVHFSDTPSDDRYERQRLEYQEGLAITPRSRVRVPTERDYDRLIAQVAATTAT